MESFPDVDAYLEQSEQWPHEISALRPILLGSGLVESIKWGKPCYSHEGKNIVILQEMKEFLSVMFFKGALLEDPAGILRDQGPNSRSAKRIELTSVAEIEKLADVVAAYVDEAVDVAEAGREAGPPPELVLVEELQERLDADPELSTAFESLTPGRQREYNLYFSDAKQTKTRQARVAKYVQKILAGKGMRER